MIKAKNAIISSTPFTNSLAGLSALKAISEFEVFIVIKDI